MLTQNRLRIMALKNDFLGTNAKYKEALKYYGYGEIENSPLFYPMPILKNSRTLMRQASLPRMPVPQLNSSLSKYLNAVKPFLNEVEYENTRKVASDFVKQDGIGEHLQRLLVERSKTTENWLSKWWLEKAYLEQRSSIVISSNPGTLYPKANYKTLDDQLKFATKYIEAFLDFKNYIEEQHLPTDKLGDSNLCMDQYYKLFCTCRIPEKNMDKIKVFQVYNIDWEKSNHITIMYNNRIFKLQIINPETGLGLSSSEIYSNLKNLVEYAQESGVGLGIMTAEDRELWADVYSKLSQIDENRKNFESVHESLFVMCLDTKRFSSENSEPDARSVACGQILHGNKQFTANRWFDKTIQVIIGENGVWGVNFEHSIAEALPHGLMNDYIYKHINQNNDSITQEDVKQIYSELNFVIPAEIQSVISKSSLTVNKLVDDLDLRVLSFEKFGKNVPKACRVSPDAFVQLAMQLAYFRTHDRPGNTYESGSLRKFHLGRTDIIRTCSSDVVEFLAAMKNDALSHKEKASLLLKAINSHRIYTNSVINCESFDRHLLGLKLIALENKIELPDLYKDVSYQRACHYFISSSQVSSKFEAVTSYGPLVADGYGCCYNILEHKLMFGISCYNSCKETSTRLFAENLEQSLLDCQSLLSKINSKL